MEKKCPECGKKVTVQNCKFVSHGPGKDSMFCKGSGRAAKSYEEMTGDERDKYFW